MENKPISKLIDTLVKQSKILTKIQLSAQKAGLDQMTDQEIDMEIQACRRSKDQRFLKF